MPFSVLATTGNDRPVLKTVCIDAGHGGKDPGCVSKDRRTYESRIVLDIASKLAERIRQSCPEIKVVMTRSTDTFVTLAGRAQIANDAGADLFISIHVNTAASTSASGYSVHVLGPSSNKNRDLFAYNMDVCKRENAVMFLEEDYSTTYQGFDPDDPQSFIFFNLMHNAFLEQSLLFAQDVEKSMSAGPIKRSRGIWQDPFYVLWKTAMPSALIEVGFMSNSSDLAKLRTSQGRQSIADAIFKAFTVFKKRYDGSVSGVESVSGSSSTTSTAKTEGGYFQGSGSESGDAAASGSLTSTPRYGIQVLASSRRKETNDPFFKGYKCERYRSGNIYKYIICIDGSLENVRQDYRTLSRKFSGSFIVVIDDGAVTPYR